jgi:2-keto-4-pentenoate hydratase/2-oxohepta-3-ene-1,7-dioic acid hydratase in catechol pathway
MKIVRFLHTGHASRYGILEGETIRTIDGSPYRGMKITNAYHHLAEVRLLAPCVPSKIVALGVNYRSHASEMDSRLPKEPLIFLKPPTAVIGPEDSIVYPESSHRVDYEGELAVVIGRRASRIQKEEASRCILGYSCFNDVTARDLQSLDKQWTRAKSFDTFAPIGPWIETELDPSSLSLRTVLNGEVKQDATTADLLFSVDVLVSFISHVMTLLPGDVIATGTSGGIGPMQPGDTVEITIEQIGTLRNHVVRPESL